MSSDKSVEKNNMYVNHSDTLKDKILINDLDEWSYLLKNYNDREIELSNK